MNLAGALHVVSSHRLVPLTVESCHDAARLFVTAWVDLQLLYDCALRDSRNSLLRSPQTSHGFERSASRQAVFGDGR